MNGKRPQLGFGKRVEDALIQPFHFGAKVAQAVRVVNHKDFHHKPAALQALGSIVLHCLGKTERVHLQNLIAHAKPPVAGGNAGRDNVGDKDTRGRIGLGDPGTLTCQAAPPSYNAVDAARQGHRPALQRRTWLAP
jgi:hypothetical protein